MILQSSTKWADKIFHFGSAVSGSGLEPMFKCKRCGQMYHRYLDGMDPEKYRDGCKQCTPEVRNGETS